MANEDAYNTSNSNNYAYQGSISGNNYGVCAIGTNTTLGAFTGMIRFPSVPINQGVSVNYALLYFYASNVGSSGIMRTKCYGVNEDNTAELTGDPFGRPETTAVTTISDTRPPQGGYEDYIVTSQVNEILARPGWVSGNAMAFKIKDNASDTNVWISDPASGAETYLLIRVSAAPNFKPTPGFISSPTFPEATHYGIKISKPGVDVLTTTEAQLFFTTRKKEFKVKIQGESAYAAGDRLIAHGLSYVPSVLGYVKGSTYRFKLNRDFDGALDPIGGGVKGFIGADATNIIINAGGDVYYYCFIDPLTE